MGKMNQVKNFVIYEQNAGYEKVKKEYVSKSKIPSFEIKRLEEVYGSINEDTQLYAVEVSYKKRYSNIKTYFTNGSIANDYYCKTINDMQGELLARACLSDKPSELKKIAKSKNTSLKLAVVCNPNTSVETLLSLWDSQFLLKHNILNNPNISNEFLQSVVDSDENIGYVMIARENLRRRKVANDFAEITTRG